MRTGQQPQANVADMLNGSTGNDIIEGKGGDVLITGAGNDASRNRLRWRKTANDERIRKAA